MSEETLNALSLSISCPICHEFGVYLIKGTLERIDESELGHRKVRRLTGKCPNCAQNGRGGVIFEVCQWF